MSTMPGNRFNDELRAWHNLGNDTTPAEIATLALAYEQRTQALLAVATATFADGSAMFPAQIESARRQIAPRLGLDGDEA